MDVSLDKVSSLSIDLRPHYSTKPYEHFYEVKLLVRESDLEALRSGLNKLLEKELP
jgi:hypothetical protein